MPPWFEPACAVVVLVTLALLARRPGARLLLGSYAALAVAGWLGEQTCIRLYAYYHYAPGWRVFVGDVPLLVVLIWPLVVLSALDVARALWPEAPARWPLLAGGIVLWDASLVEVVAVRAGLWSWAEGGYLHVPLIGLLGWAYFAAAASAGLSRPANARRALLGVCLLAPALTHLLLLASWWGLFRWTSRGEAGAPGLGAFALVSAGLCGLALRARARRRIPLQVAGPRVLAAGLFLALLATLGGAYDLWAHTALVALPYLLLTATDRRWPAAPGAATPTSRAGTAAAARSPGA